MDNNVIEYTKWKKTPRLENLNCIISEKIDGTHASIYIDLEKDLVLAGARNVFLTPEKDNYGFSKFVEENREELKELGNGYHRGEWWGKKIQRTYDMTERMFSMFPTGRQYETLPSCVSSVPIILDDFPLSLIGLISKRMKDEKDKLPFGPLSNVNPEYKKEGIVICIPELKIVIKDIYQKRK